MCDSDAGPSAPTVDVLDDTLGSLRASVAGGNPKPNKPASPDGGARGVGKKICRHTYLAVANMRGLVTAVKKCNKFLTYGDKASRRCKRGKECPHFHPALLEYCEGRVCSGDRYKFPRISVAQDGAFEPNIRKHQECMCVYITIGETYIN